MALRRKPGEACATRAGELLGEPPDVAAENGSGQDESGLRARVAALPERQRLAVFLRYYADLDYRTIGHVLGIETGTVSATLAAAHERLRGAIEGVLDDAS